jgi:hypothetical protein
VIKSVSYFLVIGAQKPATIDSGAVVNVPMFIEIGEKENFMCKEIMEETP